jgi:hypothetical protein
VERLDGVDVREAGTEEHGAMSNVMDCRRMILLRRK